MYSTSVVFNREEEIQEKNNGYKVPQERKKWGKKFEKHWHRTKPVTTYCGVHNRH